MHKERADQLQELVSKLPRIGTRQIENLDQLRSNLYELAIDLAYRQEVSHKANDPHWWNFADMLDDVLDMADFVTDLAKQTK